MTTPILTEAELPPVPARVPVDRHLPTGVLIYGHSEAQMKAYGRAVEAAVLAKLAAMNEPVAWQRNVAGVPGLVVQWLPGKRETLSEGGRLYAHPPAAQDREDAERWRWLASDCDGNAQDDFLRWLSGTVAPKATIDAAADAAMKGTP